MDQSLFTGKEFAKCPKISDFDDFGVIDLPDHGNFDQAANITEGFLRRFSVG